MNKKLIIFLFIVLATGCNRLSTSQSGSGSNNDLDCGKPNITIILSLNPEGICVAGKKFHLKINAENVTELVLDAENAAVHCTDFNSSGYLLSVTGYRYNSNRKPVKFSNKFTIGRNDPSNRPGGLLQQQIYCEKL